MGTEKSDDTPTPRYDEAIEFLDRWEPGGPWLVVAIDPHKKGIAAATFGKPTIAELRAWLEDQGTTRKRNLYWAVNTCKRMTKKPTKADVIGLTALHVDIDPVDPSPALIETRGEALAAHYAAERARILGKLRNLPSDIPAPSCIIDSGNGYQAFWKVKNRRAFDADVMAEVEGKNKHLEIALGGDACWNADRIMRLPGSLNRPDPKKAKKGRVVALASVVEFNDSRHDDTGFARASTDAAPSSGSNGVTDKIDTANIVRVQDLDAELPSTVPPVVKRIIACGLDEMNTDPERAGWSRSEWQWWATCEMARQGVKPEVVYSILLDPDWKISESVLDKGSGAERYAQRQVDRAFAEALDPELAELNVRHTIALLGGVVRVLTTSLEQVPATGIVAPKTTPTTPSGMELYYANRTKLVPVPGKPEETKVVPLWQWWTRHPLSARAEGVVFAPEREVEPGVFNLWHGFAVPPVEGDCQPFLDFVRRRMANRRDDVYEYILNWLALTVQRPWEPVGTALVLYSRMTGTGKNAFVDLSLGLILGHSFLYVTAEKHLFGQFSGHLATTIALHLGEAATADSVEAEGLMKALVTDRTRMSERKGIDGVSVANCLHVLMSSNQDWILRVAPEDRRYCVVDVCEERMSKEEYDSLRKHMLSGGAAALHAFLAARDISKFDVVRDRPDSVAGRNQKAHSVTGLDAAWFECLQSGELPDVLGCVGREDGSVWMPSSSFLDHLNRTRRPRTPYGPNLLRNLLTGPQENCKGAGMGFEKERKEAARQKGPQGYVIPPLAEARKRWDERRFPYTWDDDGEAGWLLFRSPDFDVLG